MTKWAERMQEAHRQWAERMQEAHRTQRAAEEMFVAALKMRCMSAYGGSRCTADASPEHVHRYAVADLPEYAR